MDKETIVSNLKVRLGTTNLSDRTISSYVDGNLLAEGIEPDEAYWTKHTTFLKALQGQFSADVAARVNSQVETKTNEFKTQWEKDHPSQQEQPPTTQPNAEYEALKARLDAMEESQKKAQKDAQVSQMRSIVTSKAESLNVNKALWEDAAKVAEIKDNGTIDDLESATKTIYEKNFKRVFGNGAQPYGGSQQQSNPTDNKTIQSRREAFKARQVASGRLPENSNN